MLQRQKHFLLPLLLLLIAIPIFAKLGYLPIRLWDESRQAANALGMLENHHWMVTYYDGQPDLWNTKPPLLIWMQALSIHFLGVNEWAIRLPVALAAFSTCLFLFFFLGTKLTSYWPGFLSILVLISSRPFIAEHVARTGDYDGLLIFFSTLSCLYFWAFLVSDKTKYLYLFFVCLGFGVLTKSIAGLFFLPSLVILSLYQKKFFSLFRNKHFYLGAGFFLVMVGSFYLLREYYHSGYLRAVYENEIGGRFLEVVEAHKHPFWYYFKPSNYLYWLPFLGLAIVKGFGIKDPRRKSLFLFSLINAYSFLILISLSKTKLEWYAAPIYPFFSVMIGLFLYEAALYVRQKLKNKGRGEVFKRVIMAFAFLLVFTFPYVQVLEKQVLYPKEASWEKPWYALSWYLKNRSVKGDMASLQSVIIDDYQPQVSFYISATNHKGGHLAQKTSEQIVTSEFVLVRANSEELEKIQKHFKSKVVQKRSDAIVLFIEASLPPSGAEEPR